MVIQSTGLVEFGFGLRLEVARPAVKVPGPDPR
jgi:hypothetical protein